MNPFQDFGQPEEGVKRLPEVEAAVRSLESSLGDRASKGKAPFMVHALMILKAASLPMFCEMHWLQI